LDHWRKRQGNYKQYCCYFVILIFHVVNFPFIVLAFIDLSSLRTHFRPFTEVVRRIRREVTRKNWAEPRIAQTPRFGKIETTEDPDMTGWIERRASAAAEALQILRSIQRIGVTAMQTVESRSIVLAVNRIDQTQ
jgi:hypothetical protein